LITAVPLKFYVAGERAADAGFVKFEIVRAAFGLSNTNDFAGFPVNDQLCL